MTNHIRTTTLEVRRLSPVEAEVWLRVKVDAVTPTTELRGKLHGPRCPGVSTVEIAYPLRPVTDKRAESATGLTVRAVIAEPNLWTESTPFVYEGVVELWEEGRLCDQTPVSVGFKMA